MAEIRSSGFQGGDVVTVYQPPEDIRDWVLRHEAAFKAATVDSSTLTTTWPSGCSVTTYQQTGESPSLHHARHWVDVTAAMQNDPPNPEG